MYTREMHLKMAKCLKAAKKLLDDGGNHQKHAFVCSTICKTRASQKTKDAISDWIQSQLGNYCFITSWAKKQGAKLETHQDYQAYRHAWMDHMIKVLES